MLRRITAGAPRATATCAASSGGASTGWRGAGWRGSLSPLDKVSVGVSIIADAPPPFGEALAFAVRVTLVAWMPEASKNCVATMPWFD
jgi:hypothetical protein